MTTIEEKRRYREAFLSALYDATDGDPVMGAASEESVGQAASIPPEAVDNTISWLVSNGLARWVATMTVGITAYGVHAIEEMRAPTAPATPAGTGNVVQVFGDVGGSLQVQQASPGAKQIAGGLDSPESIEEIRRVIDLISGALEEADLDADDRADIEEDLSLLAAEIEKAEPKRSVLRRSLLSLGRMAEAFTPAVAVALLQHYHLLGL